jgi:nucleoside-triphosphatase THEP1
VVSAPGEGKTTALERTALRLRAGGLTVGGVVQRAIDEGGGRHGYELVDVATGVHRPFARRRALPGPGGLGFDFEPDGWAWAAARIRQARGHADVLLVDELGRLEAEGRGHLPALLEHPGRERSQAWVLAVRDLAVGPLIERLGEPDATLSAPAGDGELARWVRRIGEACARR